MRGCGGSTITSLAVEDFVLYIIGPMSSMKMIKKNKFDYRFFYNDRLSFPKPIIGFPSIYRLTSLIC